MSPKKTTVPWWISADSPREEKAKQMSKIKAVRAYIGWKDTSRPALNDGRTEVYSANMPVTLRSQGGGQESVYGGSLADALSKAGAQYGDDLLVIAGSKEKIENIIVFDVSNQVMNDIDHLIESGCDGESIVQYLRSVGVQS